MQNARSCHSKTVGRHWGPLPKPTDPDCHPISDGLEPAGLRKGVPLFSDWVNLSGMILKESTYLGHTSITWASVSLHLWAFSLSTSVGKECLTDSLLGSDTVRVIDWTTRAGSGVGSAGPCHLDLTF